VYLLNGDGTVKAMRKLGAPVLSLALSGTQLVAGCRDGMVYLLDAQLQPQQAIKLDGPVTQLAVADAGGRPTFITAAGEAVVALRP
jgi:hypothetical protein